MVWGQLFRLHSVAVRRAVRSIRCQQKVYSSASSPLSDLHFRPASPPPSDMLSCSPRLCRMCQAAGTGRVRLRLALRAMEDRQRLWCGPRLIYPPASQLSTRPLHLTTACFLCVSVVDTRSVDDAMRARLVALEDVMHHFRRTLKQAEAEADKTSPNPNRQVHTSRSRSSV
jgi:hypothetical protein